MKCPQCNKSKYVIRSITAGLRICRKCFIKFNLKGERIELSKIEKETDKLY